MRSLVDCQWLAERIDHTELRVVDCRFDLSDVNAGRRDFDREHIPGAVFLDLEKDLSAASGPGRHPLPDPELFARRLGQLGIGNQHHVIAYDAQSGAVAARLWWQLRHLGHRRVSLLDGGFAAWRRAGHPVSTAAAGHEPCEFTAATRSDDTIDRAQLRSRLGAVALIDSRAASRYCGDEEPIDPVAGHIPTALNLPHHGNVSTDGHFLAPEQLAARIDSLGLDPNAPVVVYCGSGVTACHNLLAFELAGRELPLLYPGSWSDWCTAGMPGCRGTEPGEVD